MEMADVNIVGVAHISSTLPQVKEALGRMDIDSETTVFLEPKRSLLTGEERYAHPAVARFFREVMAFLRERRASVVPLNPSCMLSHDDSILYSKYGKQFAEEAYMAKVIAERKPQKGLVIIGAIHAERLARLLQEAGVDAQQEYAVPPLPENLVALSWREALEGRREEYLPLSWLERVEGRIRRKLGIPMSMPVSSVYWMTPESLERYVKAAEEAMRRYPPRKHTLPAGHSIREMTGRVAEDGDALLASSRRLEDHALVTLA